MDGFMNGLVGLVAAVVTFFGAAYFFEEFFGQSIDEPWVAVLVVLVLCPLSAAYVMNALGS
jgi:hypothetical protein